MRPLYIDAGGSAAIASLFDWGHGGVPIFFVIAGFIMVWVTDRKSRTPSRFMADRLVRIYGSYIPILLIFASYKLWVTGLPHWVPGNLNLWGSVLLTEVDPRNLLIYPAWTLGYEVFFYAVFAICLIWKLDKIAISGASAVMLLLLAKNLDILPREVSTIVSSPVSANFLIGIAVGLVLRRLDSTVTWVTWLSAAGGIVLTGGGVFMGGNSTHFSDLIFFGFGTGFLLLGIIPLERANRMPKFKLMLLLGNASYAIYLIHAPLLYIIQTQPIAGFVAYNYGANALALVFLLTLLRLSVLFFRYEDWLGRMAKHIFDIVWPRTIPAAI